MNKILCALALAVAVPSSVPSSSADEVFKIQIGRDYSRYSNAELQRRVWELERAVWQLQQQVFQLASDKSAAPAETWACTVKAMGETYTGTGISKATAGAKAIENCKKARGEGFFCKDPNCSQ